jgi:hypothetical protein
MESQAMQWFHSTNQGMETTLTTTTANASTSLGTWLIPPVAARVMRDPRETRNIGPW